jgi:hypothetical protein
MTSTLKGMFESWELQLGDMCVFVGDEKHQAELRNRVVYQVVHKELAPASSYSHHRYHYRVAFDLQNPSGTAADTVTALGTRGMKKLSLTDLCIIRLVFDNVIKEHACEQGMERVPGEGTGAGPRAAGEAEALLSHRSGPPTPRP